MEGGRAGAACETYFCIGEDLRRNDLIGTKRLTGVDEGGEDFSRLLDFTCRGDSGVSVGRRHGFSRPTAGHGRNTYCRRKRAEGYGDRAAFSRGGRGGEEGDMGGLQVGFVGGGGEKWCWRRAGDVVVSERERAGTHKQTIRESRLHCTGTGDAPRPQPHYCEDTLRFCLSASPIDNYNTMTFRRHASFILATGSLPAPRLYFCCAPAGHRALPSVCSLWCLCTLWQLTATNQCIAKAPYSSYIRPMSSSVATTPHTMAP